MIFLKAIFPTKCRTKGHLGREANTLLACVTMIMRLQQIDSLVLKHNVCLVCCQPHLSALFGSLSLCSLALTMSQECIFSGNIVKMCQMDNHIDVH